MLLRGAVWSLGTFPGAEGKLSRTPAESMWIPTISQEQGLGDCILSSHVLEHGRPPQGPRLKSQFLAASSYLQAHPVEEESIQEDLSYSYILIAFLPRVGKAGEEALGPACWKRGMQYWQEERGFKSIHLRSESLRRSIWLDRIEGTIPSSIFYQQPSLELGSGDTEGGEQGQKVEGPAMILVYLR